MRRLVTWTASAAALLALPDAAAGAKLPACAISRKSKEWKRALDVLRVIKSGSAVPDEPTYGDAVEVCRLAGRWAVALRLLGEMRSQDLQPAARTLSSALSVFQANGQDFYAAEAMRDLKRAAGAFAPHALLESLTEGAGEEYDELISCAILHTPKTFRQPWEQALGILDDMQQKAVDVGVIPGTAAMVTCIGDGMWSPVRQLFASLREGGSGQQEQLRAVTYVAAMRASAMCHEDGAWEEALALLAEMEGAGRRPNSAAYGSAVIAAQRGAQWLQALEFLRAAQAASMKVGLDAYEAAITACGSAGHWQGAGALLSEAQRQHSGVALRAFNTVLGFYEECSQWAQAIALTAEMRRCGPEPDVITYFRLIRTCNAGGQKSLGSKLAKQMLRSGCISRYQIYNHYWSDDMDVTKSWLQEMETANLAFPMRGNSVDLHGMPVRVALAAVFSALDYMPLEEDLSVITGKGLHTLDGKGKLRQAVLNVLKGMLGDSVNLNPSNHGEVIIPLRLIRAYREKKGVYP